MKKISLNQYKLNLQKELSHLEKRFNIELEHKIAKHQTIHWVTNETKALTEYLALHSLGRNWFEKFSNKFFHKYSKKIWKKSIYQKIIKKIIVDLNYRFLPREFTQVKNESEFISVTLQEVQTFFDRIFPNAIKATLIDLMNITSTIIKSIRHALDTEPSFYLNEKKNHDQLCLRSYKEIYNEVINHQYSLILSTLIATKANFIDSSTDDVNTFIFGFFEEINDWLDSDIAALLRSKTYPYFEYQQFYKLINEKPKTILYELDNCGEAIFDLLLTEILIQKGHKVILCAKLNPILNDITKERLESLLNTPLLKHLKQYLNQTLFLVDNNSASVGKNIFKVSQDYKAAFQKSDLIILKGQGNFLNMPMTSKQGKKTIPIKYKKTLIYMFTVKSEIVEYALKQTFPFNTPNKNALILKVYENH